YNGTIGSELVGGRVFADANQNAVFDSTDTPLAGHLVELKSKQLYAATDAQGRYTFDWRGHPDSLRLVPLSALSNNIGLAKYAGAPGQAFDFPVVGNNQLGDLAIDITTAGLPRPGFEFIIYLTCRNDGYLPTDARLSFVKDFVTTWSDFGELPDQLSGDTAKWIFSAIPPGGSKVVPVTLKLEAGILVGSILHLLGKVTLENLLDVQGANNVAFYVIPVVGSFDPNDKSVSPEGVITPGMVADTQRLVYTIRFQNTGNFPAEFVRVTDLISSGLDLGSFRVEAASHPMTWSLEGRTVEFFFPNIQLPDNKSDEPASHGFVKYSIAMQPNLMKGDVVNNYADIFFDFNLPIRTNTIKTKVDVVSSVVSLPVPDLPCWVTPNLVSDELTVFWEGGTAGTARLQVFNLQGTLVVSTLSESPAKVAVGSLKAGVYLLVVRAGAQEGQVGFVKI
ncbi:MAG: T9SS type A sorting domain-containing protein, partial [Saprospiraceae bacterium]